MDRRTFITAAATGTVAAVAGCTGSAQEDDLAETGVHGGVSETTDRTIEVSANGEVEAEPDEARMRVGLEATGESPEAVETELAEQAAEITETFEELGIPDDDIESGRFNVRSRRNESGYQGSHSYQIVVDDVDSVGEVISEVTAAGADDVGRINFGLTDETRAQLRDQALEEALANADEEAQFIAENRGVSITGTQSVSTRNVDVQAATAETPEPEMEVAEDDAAPGRSTEIESGPVSVTASVDVAYGFEEVG